MRSKYNWNCCIRTLQGENILKRRIVPVISDTHGGHKLGLCLPTVVLERMENGQVEKYNPQLSETQKFMAETYEWGVSEIIKLAGKDEIIPIFNGDPTHGKASFLEVMGTRMSDQIDIAKEPIDRWLQYKNVRTVRLSIGTGIHELGEGSASILITHALRDKYPNKDIGVVYHGVLDIDGFLIDYAHHGPNIGTRVWLEGNELRYYLRSIMLGSILKGRTPPNLVLRGHYHQYKREWLELNGYESWICLLPGFTFKDDYTRRATRSQSDQSVGMLAFELIDGHLHKVHKFLQRTPLLTFRKGILLSLVLFGQLSLPKSFSFYHHLLAYYNLS